MEGGLFCTYGYFGTYKTLSNVILIIEKLKNNEIVFSNIYLNKEILPNKENYFYFDDLKNIKDILIFASIFSEKISEFNKKNPLNQWQRNNRPKINVFFDEMAIFANSLERKKFSDEMGEDFSQYLVQLRKLFVNIYLIIQKPDKLVKELRQYVGYWIKPYKKPFFYFIPKIELHKQLLDDENKIIIEFEYKYNINGELIKIEKPVSYKFKDFFFYSRYFIFYDDLFFIRKQKAEMSDFLINIGFFQKLLNGKIKNNLLFNNIKIYEYYLSNKSNNKIIENDNIIIDYDSFIYNYYSVFIPFGFTAFIKEYFLNIVLIKKILPKIKAKIKKKTL